MRLQIEPEQTMKGLTNLAKDVGTSNVQGTLESHLSCFKQGTYVITLF